MSADPQSWDPAKLAAMMTFALWRRDDMTRSMAERREWSALLCELDDLRNARADFVAEAARLIDSAFAIFDDDGLPPDLSDDAL